MNQRLDVLRVLSDAVDLAVPGEGQEGGVEGGWVAHHEHRHRLGLHLLHHQVRVGEPDLVPGDEKDHFISAHLVDDFGQSTGDAGPGRDDRLAVRAIFLIIITNLASSRTRLGILPNRPSLLLSVTVVVGKTSFTPSPTEWIFSRLPTGRRLINLNRK